MDILKQIDFLGERPKIFYNNKINYKTKFGGLLSISCLIVLVLGVIFFTKILFERSNFTVTVNEQLNPDSYIDWSNKELAINVVDRLGNQFPDAERIYGITGTYFYSIKNSTIEKLFVKLINVEKCSYDKNFPVNNDLWRKEFLINGGWCPQIGQEINSQKPFGATNYSNIVYWVHMCKNTTIKNDCYPQEKIKQLLSNTFTMFKIADVYFDHNNKKQTAKTYVYTENIQTSISIYKRIFYTFKIVDYYSDDNYILTDNSLSSYVTVADSKESVDLRPLNSTTIPNSYLAISLSNNVKKQIFYRKYYKAQNLMADLGGIIKAFVLISTIINNIFVERLYYTDIINYNLNTMNISVEKCDGKLNLVDLSSARDSSRRSINKPVENCNINNPIDVNVVNKSNINNNKHKIEFPIYVSCIPKIFFSRRSNYRHVFDRLADLTNLVRKQLDVRYIISKLNDIDKLTFMFFGNDNYNIFHEAPNPYIQDKILSKDPVINPSDIESDSIITRIDRNYNFLFNK